MGDSGEPIALKLMDFKKSSMSLSLIWLSESMPSPPVLMKGVLSQGKEAHMFSQDKL